MSGPNLSVYCESSFNATDNVVQECAICGLQCEILFPAEGIKNMANFVLYCCSYFILHSRESELYRYILDGKFALAWELLFPRFMGHLSSHKGGGVPLSALPKDTTSELAGLFTATSHKCRASSREAVDTIF